MDNLRLITLVDQPGWFHHHRAANAAASTPCFVLPTGEAVGNADVELRQDARIDPRTNVAGTLEGWMETARAALLSGVDHLAVGVVTGFVGPILPLVEHDSIVVVFTGETCKGKTTAQRLGASVWGSPKAHGEGLLYGMRMTPNAAEAILVHGNHAYCGLNEAMSADRKELPDILSRVAGHSGKARLRADGGGRGPRPWLTGVTISGGTGIARKIRAAGERLQGGAVVHVVEVDVSDAPSLPPSRFDEILAVHEHHGHAGKRYVRYLLDEGLAAAADDRLREGLEKYAEALCGPDAEPRERRTARLYAVLQVAGELAQDAGLLPEDYDVAR